MKPLKSHKSLFQWCPSTTSCWNLLLQLLKVETKCFHPVVVIYKKPPYRSCSCLERAIHDDNWLVHNSSFRTSSAKSSCHMICLLVILYTTCASNTKRSFPTGHPHRDQRFAFAVVTGGGLSSWYPTVRSPFSLEEVSGSELIAVNGLSCNLRFFANSHKRYFWQVCMLVKIYIYRYICTKIMPIKIFTPSINVVGQTILQDAWQRKALHAPHRRYSPTPFYPLFADISCVLVSTMGAISPVRKGVNQ